MLYEVITNALLGRITAGQNSEGASPLLGVDEPPLFVYFVAFKLEQN